MMDWQYTTFALPLLVAATISTALVAYAWQHRGAPGAASFGVLMLAVAEWALAYALELSGADLQTKLFWAKVQYLGIVTVPPAFLAFALQYTGREKWLTGRNLMLLAVIPAITLLLASTNETHGLIWTHTALSVPGPFLALDHGAWFWIHVAYSYLLLMLGTILLTIVFFRSTPLYRKQSAAIMMGALVPWAGNAVYVFDLSPVSHLDLTPFAFTVTGMALAWGLFRYQLLDIMPVAHDLVFKGMNDGAIVVNAQDRVVDINPAAQRILGCTTSEAVGRAVAEVLPDQILPLERYREESEVYEEVRLGNGPAQRDYHLALTPLQAQDGRRKGYLIVLRDITEHKLKERLDYLAHYDLLTGLPNRTLFQDRLSQEIIRARRSKDLVALLFLDLDRFKLVNDTLGHKMGDLLLQQVARRLTACLRESDTVTRWGGDEFTVILSGITRRQDVTTIAQQILNALSDIFVLEGHEFFITASIGICLYPSDAHSPTTLVRNADIAMYRAKARGKGRYEVYTEEMSRYPLRQLNLETDLRRAIELQQLKVYYQPVVLLETGKIAGAEALVRWQHPERGLIPPSRFMPIAEETGLIVSIGQRVLQEACQQVQAWQEQYPSDPPLMMFVNFSIRQFQQLDLVTGILSETGLDPRSLVLEIHEGAVINEYTVRIDMLHELKSLGVGLAIDDFGTAYSSLSYLKHLPVDF